MSEKLREAIADREKSNAAARADAKGRPTRSRTSGGSRRAKPEPASSEKSADQGEDAKG